MKKLGIVGHGFVGSAINQGFTKNVKKYVVDPNKFGSNTIQQLIKFKPDAVFVSVPTPQLESGDLNKSIHLFLIRREIKFLNFLWKTRRNKKSLII